MKEKKKKIVKTKNSNKLKSQIKKGKSPPAPLSAGRWALPAEKLVGVL